MVVVVNTPKWGGFEGALYIPHVVVDNNYHKKGID